MSASAPQPFKISVPQSAIDRLQQRLSLASFPDELEDAGWDYGCPLSEIKRLVKAWQQWDWRKAERKFNQTPMFTLDIPVDGFGNLNIHFVHQKSEIVGAIPLLFVHGWPGSFIEVLKLLPLLSDSQRKLDSPAFDIIAPSLPNFGFSQGVSKRGFGIAQYAEVCHKLMLALGYEKYATQGGDWGFYITRALASFWPENCKASHYNMIRADFPYNAKVLAGYSEREQRGLERTKWFEKEGRGYSLLQSTCPQTISYALQDSPVALLSWIYEKLINWTDSYSWTDEEVLSWISIYLFSRAGPGASVRIYYENKNATHTVDGNGNWEGKRVYTRDDSVKPTLGVKLGMSWNPKELVILPKSWCRTLGEVVYEYDNDHGGHFYAYEHADWLVRDLQTMFGKSGGAYSAIKGKTGYDSRRV